MDELSTYLVSRWSVISHYSAAFGLLAEVDEDLVKLEELVVEVVTPYLILGVIAKHHQLVGGQLRAALR